MPREFVIVTPRTPTTDDLRAAASRAGVEVIVARAKEGAIDILVDPTGNVMLSLEYTQHIRVPDEIARLAPAAAAAVPDAHYWTNAWAAFGDRAEAGERIAVELARLCDGVCVREDGSV